MIEIASSPVLATKLHIPRPRRTLTTRLHLLARLEEGFRRPLTLVIAPPGFGKTTLIAAWAAQCGHPVAWLSLDPADNDPTRFWAYVIAALETLQPGIGHSALALLDAPQPAPVETVLTALINAVEPLSADFGLVLDDYNAIANDGIHQALAFLLSHIPAPLHIIMATRVDPMLPLSRLRARDQMVELRAADLRFTLDETGNFLQNAMQLQLGSEEIAALDTRTEGWIAGLQLAALALRGQEAGARPDFIMATASTNRFVVDYLVEEVLQGQDDSRRDFLRQTSILDRLCAPLCDAVTGRHDSQALLDDLEHGNLFLTALDSRSEWYRYHTLFGDVLRKLLRQNQADLVPELQRRASVWYEEHHLTREAIGHALAVPDYERAARLIEEVAMATIGRGEVVTMLAWLKALPKALIRSRPALCMSFAAAEIVAGDLEAVEPWLAEAERGYMMDPPPVRAHELLGQIDTMRAILASSAGDTARVIELTGRALDRLPARRVFWRGITSWMRGLAFAEAGGGAAADRTFAETIAMSQLAQSSSAAALSLYTFGFLEQRHGRLGQAEELYRCAMRVLEERDAANGPLAGQVYLGLGELARLQDDLEAAEEYLRRGLSISTHLGSAESAAHGYISMAWLRQARGDLAGALSAIDAALEWAQDRIGPGTRTLLLAHRAHLWIVQGNVVAAEWWALERKLYGHDEVATAGYVFSRHSESMTFARLHLAQHRPADALAILESLSSGLGGGRWIGVLVLMALARHALGDIIQAYATLARALALGAAEGYVRTFTDEGAPVMELLDEGRRSGAWAESTLATHANRLLAAGIPALCPQMAEQASAPVAAPRAVADLDRSRQAALGTGAHKRGLAEPLSQRELEVLRLAGIGLGNRAIAEHLTLSVGTVKSHLHNIFGKLGAETREQALARAQELDLLQISSRSRI